MMKDGVIFLNLSRGYVVDIEALARNLRKGKVRGAAVDVFPEEPRSNKEQFTSPLQGIRNVILTPHIGGSTEEAQQNIGVFVAARILRYIDSGPRSPASTSGPPGLGREGGAPVRPPPREHPRDAGADQRPFRAAPREHRGSTADPGKPRLRGHRRGGRG
jgi:hypothetical protein